MAGAEEFRARMLALEDHVGRGILSMRVAVDQVYAKYQELRDDLKHPGGGQAHALQQALYQQVNLLMQDLADHMLDEEGLREVGRRHAERMARRYYELAPFEFGDLKASASPTVLDDGEEIYHRPPGVHRLTKEELKAKGYLRSLGLGHDLTDDEILSALDVG